MKLKIGELGKVITGNTPSKKIKEFWGKDDVGFVKPDIISDEHIVRIKNDDCNEFISNAAISKARIVPKNSVFVTCIGNIGKIGVATEDLAFNQQINAIIPNENVNLDYLCYAIFANKTRLQDIANAPIVPLLNKSQFSKFELEFDMDINTQTRIVQELNTVSNIILKYKQELLLLDELVRARFVEMFGDLRVNDKGWKYYKLDELTELITDGEHATPKRTTQGIYLLSARNVLNHQLSLEDVDYIDYDEFSRISRRIIPREGDVLISCSGSIGRCCVVPKNIKFQMVRSIALLRFKPNVNPIFAEYMITSDYLQDQINKSKTASSQANLFQGKIKSLKGVVPPLELQNQFASFVQEIDKSRSRIQKSLEASQELFDSLMQEYFG